MEIKINKNGSESYKEKVYLANGQPITKTFHRKTDARDWKRQVESEKVKNALLGIQPLKENLSFADIFKLWMERKIEPAKSYKTIADYKCIGKKHLLSLFESIKIRSIERGHADLLLQNLRKLKLANRTINKVMVQFKQILNFAEIEGHINKNPLRGFPALKLDLGRVDFLTQQEILQLLRANATLEIYPLLLVALNTGMRVGELTGLCWDRLNFDTNTIEVSRTLSRNGLRETTKTNLARHIPMNPEVNSTLRSLMRAQRNPQYVFADQNGKPFNPDHFSLRYFRKALVRANVRNVTFHILRHTYASQFMMNGGNIYDLQKILGHTKVEMTMKYAHLSPQHLEKVVQTVRFSAEGNMSVSPFLAPRQKETRNLSVG